jgi:hypothetical protein
MEKYFRIMCSNSICHFTRDRDARYIRAFADAQVGLKLDDPVFPNTHFVRRRASISESFVS